MKMIPIQAARWLSRRLLCLLLAAPIIAQAASPSIWNGGGDNDNWNNANNWSGNVPVPGTSYDLQFGGNLRLTPQNDFAAGSSFRHLTFNSDAGLFNLSGNGITLAGNLTNNSTGLQTISLPITISAARTVAASSGDVSLNGSISGAGGLTMVGSGFVTLKARNTFSGATTVNGNLLLPTGGAINVANNFIIGQSAGHNGAMRITGGTVTNTQATGTGNMMIGRAGWGTMELSSGTVKVNQTYIGWTAGYGTALIDGGSYYCGTGSDYVVIGTTSGGAGVLTVTSGLFNHAGANRAISLNNNGDSRGEINVLGGTIDNGGGIVSFGLNTQGGVVGTGAGVVSLNGGTLILNRFVSVSQNFGATPGSSYLNFNGGTLKASAYRASVTPAITVSSNFIPALTAAYVNGPFGTNAGGAVIDTAGETCLVETPLLAPSGNGIASVPVADGGTGYMGAPYVSIVGDGVAATAIANMVDDGTGKGTYKIDSILVCNPGAGYSSAVVALTGGNPTTAAAIGNPTLAANTSGGLTKNGAGSLTLLGANTYTGATVVNGGRLILSSVHAGAGNLTANDGGAIGVLRSVGVPTLNVASLTLGSTTGAEVEFVLPDGNPSAEVINVGTLTLTGLNRTTVSGANFAVGPGFPLIKYTTLVGDPASLTNGVLTPPDGTLAKLVHNPGNHSFDLVITAISGALKWTGNVSSGGVGVWDNMTTPNWINNGVAKVFIPGADTTLDDTAPGVTTIALAGLIEPGVFTVANNSKNYTIGGTGTLNGATSLTKSGTGKLTMTNVNTYAGATIVNGGTLVMGGSLSNSAGPVTITEGTLSLSGEAKTGTGAWSIGNTASSRGILTITAGATVDLNGNFIAGSIVDGNGAVNISGGTLTNAQGSAASNFEIATTGYGALNMSAGLVKVNTLYIGGNAGVGVGLISGGQFYAGAPGSSDYLLVGGVASGTGVLTVQGGLLSHAGANRLISINNNSDGRGELNLLGGAIDNTGGGIGYGYNAGNGTGTGIVNINAGTLTLNRFVNTKQGGTLLTGNSFLNLNGGVIVASPSTLGSPSLSFSSSFIPARMDVRVNGPFGSFAGGAIIDTAGQNCLIESPLQAPTGSGVRTLAVADGGSGYIGAPYVSISGDGTGASAIANMVSDGNGALKVGSVTVCNPGVNYTDGAVYFSFIGGAPITPATPGSVTTAVNTSGGLTKNGAGRLTLAAANTYTGATIVNDGTLLVDGALDPASAVTVLGGTFGGLGVVGGPVNVQSGATFAPGGATIGTLTLNNNLTLAAGSQTFVRVNAETSGNDQVQGISTLNYGGKLVLTNTSGSLAIGKTFQIFSAASHNTTFAEVQSADGAAKWSFDAASGMATVLELTATNPTNMTYSVTGNTLGLSWPASHLGWYAQSNSVNVADSAAWQDIPNSQFGTNLDITISPATDKVFYRLRKP